MMRKNLSILIVAMVKDEQILEVNTTESISELTCIENRIIKDAAVDSNGHSGTSNEGFEWDAFTRGQILGAFSIGYLTTQVRSYIGQFF